MLESLEMLLSDSLEEADFGIFDSSLNDLFVCPILLAFIIS
jgi:hypothetical protein